MISLISASVFQDCSRIHASSAALRFCTYSSHVESYLVLSSGRIVHWYTTPTRSLWPRLLLVWG